MPKTDFLSSNRVFPGTAHCETQSQYLAAFEGALNSLVRAWGKYQPNDSLSATREQDLEWLKSTLRDYRQNIHNSSNSRNFWKGCIEGKDSRRTITDQYSKSLVQILLGAFKATKAQQIYELGVQVGWRYARLKDYLVRIKKQRKIEQAQQLKDYQQFLKLIRRNGQTQDMDSLISFGCVQERKSEK